MFRGVILIIVCLGALTTGCGSDGGSSDAGCGSKNLFSNWTLGAVTLSFAGMDFDSIYSYQVQFSGGEICEMDVQFSGTQCSGSTSVTNAAYVSGGAGDPGCAAFDGPSTFTKSAAGLELCDVSGCNTLQ